MQIDKAQIIETLRQQGKKELLGRFTGGLPGS